MPTETTRLTAMDRCPALPWKLWPLSNIIPPESPGGFRCAPGRRRPSVPSWKGLVELGLAAHNLAVGGDPASRAHQHDVPRDERTHRHHFDLAVGTDALRLVGQQGGQGVQRPLGLAQGSELRPAAADGGRAR